MKVVFLGPCIAKKQEAIGDERVRGAIDAILTFEELALWLKDAGIDLHALRGQTDGESRSEDQSAVSGERRRDPVRDHGRGCRRIS